jgi:hypothetical protein
MRLGNNPWTLLPDELSQSAVICDNLMRGKPGVSASSRDAGLCRVQRPADSGGIISKVGFAKPLSARRAILGFYIDGTANMAATRELPRRQPFHGRAQRSAFERRPTSRESTGNPFFLKALG